MVAFIQNSESKGKRIDFWLIAFWLFLVIAGWLNIYSAVYTEEHSSIFDFSQRYGMQFLWITASLIVGLLIIYVINPSTYSVLSPGLYIVMLALLLAVSFLGKEVHGSKSWFDLGAFAFQPAEFSKITTSLLLAYTMSIYGFSLKKPSDAIKSALIVFVPILLIIMEKETGSALVYMGFILVFYMEGLAGWVIILGLSIIALFVITLKFSPLVAVICTASAATLIRSFIRREFMQTAIMLPIIVLLCFLPSLSETKFFSFLNNLNLEIWALIILSPILILWIKSLLFSKSKGEKYLFFSVLCAVLMIFSVNYIFDNVLQPHQRGRIEEQLGITNDPHGLGYNVHQSKIAIGSGGFTGKGFLNGTQTKYNFVPEQSTDFIFCTVGEEWGFLGSIAIIVVYLSLIIRIILLASKNKDGFSKIYGYCIASIFTMHVLINLGMTMGLVPVIGIPLPLLSYGGSSMISFTILLFIFIRLDMERQNNKG